VTDFQKRLAELREMAVRTLEWSSPRYERSRDLAHALLALLPVVAQVAYEDEEDLTPGVLVAFRECQTALTKPEAKR